MEIYDKKKSPEKLAYRGYLIILHPYAGGFKSHIFAPGEGTGLESTPVLVGPDGVEHMLQKEIIQKSKDFIDNDIAKKAATVNRR